MLETPYLGTFWDICFQNSQKKTDKNLKKTPADAAKTVYMEAADKEISRCFARYPKDPGLYLCGMGGTEGGFIQLGVKIGFNELTFLVFHTALIPRVVLWPLHSGMDALTCLSTLPGNASAYKHGDFRCGDEEKNWSPAKGEVARGQLHRGVLHSPSTTTLPKHLDTGVNPWLVHPDSAQQSALSRWCCCS